MQTMKKRLLPLLLAIAMLLMSVSVSAASSSPTTVDVSKITVSAGNVSYNGKTNSKLTIKYGDKTLKEGTDFTVSGKGKKPGTYTLTIKGLGQYAKLNTTVKYTIAKQDSKLKLQKKKGKKYISAKYKTTKNGKITLKVSKKKATYLLTSRYTVNGKHYNKVKSYKIVKKSGKISFNKSTRKLTVKGKGTMKIKLTFADSSVKPVTITVKAA